LNPKLDFCREVHQKEYAISPVVVASSPGKVSLMGDYTEFAQGFLLSVAISPRLWVSVSARSDAMVRFFSREYNERKKSAASNLKFRKEDRWANYPKGVLAAFVAQGVRIEGLDLAICGDIPQGIGLGSSQALCLASALAFNEFFNTGLTQLQLVQIAQRAEMAYLSMGSEVPPPSLGSTYVQAFAADGHLVYLDTRTFEWETRPLPPEAGELSLLNSRVPSSSFDTSSSKARAECESCLRHLTKNRGGRTLRDFTKLDLRDRVGTLPESARRRSLHVIEEMTRTQEAWAAFGEQDYATVGRLMHRSHDSLRDLYEVSCPEIDWLVKRLQEADLVVGARMTGEETGGCVVSLAKPDAWKGFRHQSEEYVGEN